MTVVRAGLSTLATMGNNTSVDMGFCMGQQPEYKPTEEPGCVLWLLAYAEARATTSMLLLLPKAA